MTYGGIEAGGTKWVCAIGDGDGELITSETFPTTNPTETISRAVGFFLDNDPTSAVGIGSFGPLDLRASSPTFGQITSTPKPGWALTDILGPLRAGLGVPVMLDTDVNVAALGEWRWGSGRGLDTFSYITVGTGIGGGAVVNGRILHGLSHPELGHIRIPHDRHLDPFVGSCPYHQDCFEGLASGEAIRQRWGRPAEELLDDQVWRLEADYLALGFLSVIYTSAPQRLIIGGGVMQMPELLPMLRTRVLELAAGYALPTALTQTKGIDAFICAPGLGTRSGIVGAIELARTAEGQADEVGDSK